MADAKGNTDQNLQYKIEKNPFNRIPKSAVHDNYLYKLLFGT